MPYFVFMTGATRYRIEAQDEEEALRIAFEALDPTEDAKALIRSTLYEENEGKKYVE